MVQVENEYGSFGSDHSYMEQIHQDIVDAGFSKSLIYTADGPDLIPNGSLPGFMAGINFAPGNAPKAFATLHKLRPDGPFMATEWWDGWFDHWGGDHHTTDAKAQADELQWILTQGYSISIYMVHGGTSFGWMNGANMDHTPYQPDVTSYDYDSAIDESGRPAHEVHPLPRRHRQSHRRNAAADSGCRSAHRHASRGIQRVRLVVANPAAALRFISGRNHGGSQPIVRLHSLPNDTSGSGRGRPGS